MGISLKQLAFSLTLLIIGGGVGVLGSRYLPCTQINHFSN